MDPTNTTPTPGAQTPDAAGTLAVPGVGTDATGMGAPASTTPGALDFTGNSANGLSMADSLASAQDNLTSAGMAANDTVSNPALGLEQIGSSDPSATMEHPEEPLIPAAPVPGSIGSVTSGPAMTADPATAAAAPAAAAAPTAEVPASAPYNPFAATADQTAPAAETPAADSAAPASQPDMSQTSSTNVPTALQPKTSKFSMKGDKKPVMVWILGVVAGLLAIAMIVFMVLWIQDKDKEKVVYVPNTPVQVEPENKTISAVCTFDRVAGEEDGMEGLNGIASTVTLNYLDDVLVDYNVLGRYTFDDPAQAEASRSLFATMVALFTMVGAESEESPLSADFDIDGSVVKLDMKTNVTAALETEGMSLDLPMDEATGEYLLDMESTKAYLEEQGYVCE